MNHPTVEHQRLDEDRQGIAFWKRWGPYVSERAWATVREDYSPDGAAWHYFPHDHARSRAYRWGEDGLAGICDRYQLLCFALALWNERDPILKERLFGLVPGEGNHGEDVKEYYFYLDSTPTHSYMKYLYKYPQAAFPYTQLIEENRRRGPHEPEYELLDTGVFDEDRYFDVFVEYAKADPEDICIRIEAFNRGPDPAPLHILPHLWFRNTWAWGPVPLSEPVIRAGPSGPGYLSLLADDSNAEPLRNLPFEYRLGPRYLVGEAGARLLFTNNETNFKRLYGPGAQNRKPYVKDAFHRHLIHGEDCVSPEPVGTKACFHYVARAVPPGGSVVVRLRLSPACPADGRAWDPREVDAIIDQRRREADAFYEAIHPPRATPDERLVQRQALAGMLWTKQIYLFDVRLWQDGDNPLWPPPETRRTLRNVHWRHLNSMRILTMPDKWEYPWFAAWDLAFQCVPLALVDPEFAKEQLWLLLFEQFQHPNGQIPAYEWEFADLNPPVHAWAVWRVYNMDRRRTGRADRLFLEKCFHKLLINFAWWVNRVDSDGNNIFEGGFLGLDNITVFDRSSRLPGGATLKQSDATGWMGMFCLNLMRIALELAKDNQAYMSLATKFFEHYVYIGAAMKHMGGRAYELWSERDGFFYDVLRYADGSFHKFRVRSLVGLIPLYAIERLEEAWLEHFPEFRVNLEWFLQNRQEIVQRCVATIHQDGKKVHVLALINEGQLRRLLTRVWDPAEFRSEYGLRSLSKYHEKHPFVFGDRQVRYEPAESSELIKGGNSNWRGPVWFQTTFMMIESLRKLGQAYGQALTIDSPVPGEPPVTLMQMAEGFANRLIRVFTRDASGRRPVHGNQRKFQEDPHWRDLILFYEYFHGDSGVGLGASHQTGWTGLVATLIDEWRR
ncbi:MAG TPA: glucosidase [Gemmataceae bacterium]|nr:glucosidase [Gemmataceae bacterium]